MDVWLFMWFQGRTCSIYTFFSFSSLPMYSLFVCRGSGLSPNGRGILSFLQELVHLPPVPGFLYPASLSLPWLQRWSPSHSSPKASPHFHSLDSLDLPWIPERCSGTAVLQSRQPTTQSNNSSLPSNLIWSDPCLRNICVHWGFGFVYINMLLLLWPI